MQPIVTLTMNPALDIATATDRVVPTHKLRCAAPRYDPGGGGINVARAVHALGGECGRDLPGRRCGGRDDPASVGRGRCRLRRRRHCRVHPRKSRSRRAPEWQPISVHPARDPKFPSETRNAASTSCPCWRQQADPTSSPAAVCRSASPMISMRGSRHSPNRWAKRLVLDTSGAALKQAGGGIYLLKPSLRELQDLVGREIRTEREQEWAARAGDRTRPQRDRRPVARRGRRLARNARRGASASPRSRSRREARSARATACWRASFSACHAASH